MRTNKPLLESASEISSVGLNELAVSLLSINDESELLKLLKKSIAEVSPGLSYVISVMQSDKLNFRIVESNVLSTFRRQVGKVVGKDPFHIDFPFSALSEDQVVSFKSGRLHYFEDGIYDITMGKINRIVAHAIEKLLKIQGVYSIGFSGGDEIYASTTFFVPNEMCFEGKLHEDIKRTLESICNLFSIVFKRIRAINELKISQKELRKANAELKGINESKDLFLKLISHDIINPFNTTLGYLNLLSDGFENLSTIEKKEYVERSLNGTAEEKGSGLGLLLCKELVDLNRGTLSVSSAQKAGTKVTVNLPSA
ncbi:MAG: hypothetical protein HN352_07010 [Bacteroidetes bacterium]|jgi:hypothetical protein|nr:hypothetical protein [Bacteroidota bacterium]MBT3749483.1 hypothetical protein [Bacteroidota bacterium]MBT4401221.1 hypothetical protein [Bacteroidota bacterium]MBT4411477.1 hypothetical protein [Bacteroidota bacterium]MBT7465947.1 hypothetical protein [Bacteroidota bacterium]